MGKRQLNWEKDNRRRKEKDIVQEKDESTGVYKATLSARNALHIAWLDYLLSLPEINSYELEKAVKSLVWLRVSPLRTLSPAWTRFFQRTERACVLRRKGVPPPPIDPKMLQQRRKKTALRAIRWAEARVPRPAWMEDPYTRCLVRAVEGTAPCAVQNA